LRQISANRSFPSPGKRSETLTPNDPILRAAQRKAAEVVARLRNTKLAKAAELVETALLRDVRTNNPLERSMREIRRRTRVVGTFPNGNSVLNLAAARLRHIAGTCKQHNAISLN